MYIQMFIEYAEYPEAICYFVSPKCLLHRVLCFAIKSCTGAVIFLSWTCIHAHRSTRAPWDSNMGFELSKA